MGWSTVRKGHTQTHTRTGVFPGHPQNNSEENGAVESGSLINKQSDKAESQVSSIVGSKLCLPQAHTQALSCTVRCYVTFIEGVGERGG